MNLFGVLYVFELKKILRQKIVFVSLLLVGLFLAALQALTLLGEGFYYRYRAEDQSLERVSKPYGQVEALRRDFLRSLSGQVLDEALMEQLKKGYEDSDTGTVFWNLNLYSPFLYLNTMEEKSKASAADFARGLASGFLARERCDLTDEETVYWKERAERLGLLTLDYAGGWQAMAGNCDLVCLAAMLLVSLGLCRSFSGEYRYRTRQLTLSSAKGKTTLFAARFAAGLSFAGGTALALFCLQLALCNALYGTDGFSTPLQLWTFASSSALCLSIGQFVLALFALLLLASWMTAAFVMLLSELSRSAVPALAAPFLLTLASVLELFDGMGRLPAQLASYLPVLRVSEHTLNDCYLVSVGSIKLNSLEFSFVLYPMLGLLFGALCRRCYRS